MEKNRNKGGFHKRKLRSRNGKMPQLVMLLKQIHFQGYRKLHRHHIKKELHHETENSTTESSRLLGQRHLFSDSGCMMWFKINKKQGQYLLMELPNINNHWTLVWWQVPSAKEICWNQTLQICEKDYLPSANHTFFFIIASANTIVHIFQKVSNFSN